MTLTQILRRVNREPWLLLSSNPSSGWTWERLGWSLSGLGGIGCASLLVAGREAAFKEKHPFSLKGTTTERQYTSYMVFLSSSYCFWGTPVTFTVPGLANRRQQTSQELWYENFTPSWFLALSPFGTSCGIPSWFSRFMTLKKQTHLVFLCLGGGFPLIDCRKNCFNLKYFKCCVI